MIGGGRDLWGASPGGRDHNLPEICSESLHQHRVHFIDDDVPHIGEGQVSLWSGVTQFDGSQGWDLSDVME
jgi:hypothetical protein